MSTAALEAWTVPRLPEWEARRCFIIAGGRSVPRAQLMATLLPGNVIAIKDAVLIKPDAEIMFYSGRRFHKERPDLWGKYRGPMIVKRTVDKDVPVGVLQVRRKAAVDGINGLSEDPRYLGGFCSGGSALNLAFHLGAREIVLIGYDLSGQHWNPLHPLPRANPRIHETHRLSIDAMAEPLKRHGVRVINTSPWTALRNFERGPLKNFL